VQCAIVFLETIGREPETVRNLDFLILAFDEHGRLDRKVQEQQLHDSATLFEAYWKQGEAQYRARKGEGAANILHAAHTFEMKKYDQKYRVDANGESTEIDRHRHLWNENGLSAVHSHLRVSASSLGPVIEQFNNVIADQHMLSAGNELPVSSAGVVCHAILSIGPVGDQNHHPSTFLDQNPMADQSRNTGDMVFHVSHDLLQQIIADDFTNLHSCGSH